jgi:hypothetical protein
MTHKMAMEKKLHFFFLIAMIGCDSRMEDTAISAAKDYCNCITNRTSAKNDGEKYAECNSRLAKNYRMLELYFKRHDDLSFNNSLSKSTNDSIDKFMDRFLKMSDSCQTIKFLKSSMRD